MGVGPVRTSIEPSPQEERLDSWKDIATYLKRSVPTVQRWEKEEGLPVHRHLHKKQGSVYAYKPELDSWLELRRTADSTEDEKDGPPPAATDEIREKPVPPRATVAAIVVALLVVAGWLMIRGQSPGQAAQRRVMVAVLPFQNLGGGSELDYVCDGMTEELITELAALDPKQLGIIARTSAMVYKSGGVSVHDIGKQLGVEYVVEGSILFAEGESRVTVQLIRVSDQSHLWAHTYDGKIEKLLGVEQEISRAVAEEVNVHVSSPSSSANARSSSDPEAYRLYMQARQLWYKRSHDDLEKSIELLDGAVKRDPQFAPAYAALADSYNQLGYLGFRPLGLTIPKAQQAAQKALELNPRSAEAHADLGFINAMWLWEWNQAETHYQRAIELDPLYVPAHHYYALFLASAGRLKEAEQQMEIALKLDPLAASVNSGAAYVWYFDHQYDRSIEYCQRALQLDPQFAIAHALLGWNYTQGKQFSAAINELKRSLDLSPDNPLYVATLARAYILNGQGTEADRILRQLDDLSKKKWVGGTAKAIVYAAKGDREQTMQWLESAAKQEDGLMLWLKVTPEFDTMRSDQRFQKLLEQLKLPPSIQ